ncbi:uncharacterized protein CEXT_540862 [Caerostris extrusa]|uniref:Uncharacterized protein n=1 Tax=Caerostris extrusa TaxID=172846 RepID=A0AAV4SBW8_CAEEX|nr:uncharacterized protein CEXT_540862 [Caerostris extrusa]
MAGSAGRRNILRELGAFGHDNDLTHHQIVEIIPVSPDEAVIHERGLHRKSPTYNYVIHIVVLFKIQFLYYLTVRASDPIFFKTPTKSPKKSPAHARFLTPTKTPPARSSPRKRSNNATPDKLGFNDMSLSCKSELNVKPNPILEKGLKAFSHEQLIQLIRDAAEFSPEVKQLITQLLPEPDLKPIEERLSKLKQNVYKSFPRNIWGSQESSFCFMRVKTHLEAFRKECSEICHHFMDSQHWPAVFEFIFIAWKYTLDLPHWDTSYHNKIKNNCMKYLAAQCVNALKKANLNKSALTEIIERMQEFSDEPTIKSCINFAADMVKKL